MSFQLQKEDAGINYLSKEETLLLTKLNKSKIILSDYVKWVTGYSVLPFNRNDYRCRNIESIINRAAISILASRVSSSRINETSNAMESIMSRALVMLGMDVSIPEGQSVGYPDRLVTGRGIHPFFLEIKSSEDKQIDSTLRGFYMSGELNKIKQDAYHLCILFKMKERDLDSDIQDMFMKITSRKKIFIVDSYRIKDLSDKFELTLKCEFNASSKELNS